MNNNDNYNDPLVDTIYEASIDESKWQDVVDIMSERIPGAKTSLSRRNFDSQSNVIFLQSGFERTYVEQYQEYFYKKDPIPAILANREPNSLKTDDILFQSHEISHAEYYYGHLRPQNIKKGVYVKLNSSTEGIIWLSKSIEEKEDGKITADSLSQTRTYLPHISRAIQISKHISRFKIGILNLESTLDKIAASVFIINSSQSVTYANLAARKLIALSTVLKLDPLNHIQARHQPSDERLQTAINFTLTHRQPSPPMRIYQSDNKNPLVAIALRYHRESEWQPKLDSLFSDVEESICLFVFDPCQRTMPIDKVVAAAFNLTPAQIPLALALAQGDTLKDYSDRIGISRNTARNHLASIMVKMDISRQSELASIIARLSTVISGPNKINRQYWPIGSEEKWRE